MKFNEHDTQPYDWDAEGVYVIEPTDPVEGGPDGVSNCQAKELTRRTRNLHTRMTVAEGEIDTLQEQTPIQVAAALRTANTYTDGKDTVLRSDMAIADTAAIRAAKSYADQVVAALVDNSPAALNTLQELAKALGDDPNFSTTVMTEIGKRMKITDVTAALAGKADKGETILRQGIRNSVDDLKTTGYYFVTVPEFGTLLVVAAYHGDKHPMQMLVPFGTSRMKLRSFNSDAGTWSPWVEMYHSGNFDPATKADTNHGHNYVSTGYTGAANADSLPYSEGLSISTYSISDSEIGMLINVASLENTKLQLRIFDYNGRMGAYIRGSKTNTWRELYHTGNLDKTKLDAMPSKIIRGSVNAEGQHGGGNATIIGPLGDGIVRVTHYLDSTNYSAIATVNCWGNGQTSDNEVNIWSKTKDHVDFVVTNGTGGDREFAPFDFIIMPY